MKTIGDAVMVRAESAAVAVRFGIDLAHHEMAQHVVPRVGVGIAWGSASDRGGDWIGSTVNTAARIAALAQRGEVLLSAEAREAAGEIHGISFHRHDTARLRGIRRSVETYEAGCEDAAALYIDPVCRMALAPGRSHGRLSHDGLDYYFCSEECLQTFRGDLRRSPSAQATGPLADSARDR